MGCRDGVEDWLGVEGKNRREGAWVEVGVGWGKECRLRGES